MHPEIIQRNIKLITILFIIFYSGNNNFTFKIKTIKFYN